MKYSVTIDQIQEGLATLIDDATGEICFNMPAELLPADIQEGDCLDFDIQLNPSKREQQESSAADLLAELMQGKHLT